MSRQRPFTIRIFVAEGLPDGLRLVEKSNWIGRGIVCPRGRYAEVKDRDEFSRSGVYLLVGRDGDQPRVYIGEAEEVRSRLTTHYKEKDFWQEAIVFTTTGTALNKAQVKYLEARLVELAEKYKRSKLENSKVPRQPGLAEPDREEMEGYLDELLSLLPVLGVAFFEESEAPEGLKYSLKMKGCSARGFETNTGFTVLRRSLARGKTLDSMKQRVPSYYRQRQELIGDGVLVLDKDSQGYRFTKDWPFTSPSAAAAVCYGGSANGLTAWKDESGTTLKANRAKAAGA